MNKITELLLCFVHTSRHLELRRAWKRGVTIPQCTVLCDRLKSTRLFQSLKQVRFHRENALEWCLKRQQNRDIAAVSNKVSAKNLNGIWSKIYVNYFASFLNQSFWAFRFRGSLISWFSDRHVAKLNNS